MATPKKPKKVTKERTVRVPVMLTDDQHSRFLKAAVKAGGMELAPFLRWCAEATIRREGLG